MHEQQHCQIVGTGEGDGDDDAVGSGELPALATHESIEKNPETTIRVLFFKRDSFLGY